MKLGGAYSQLVKAQQFQATSEGTDLEQLDELELTYVEKFLSLKFSNSSERCILYSTNFQSTFQIGWTNFLILQ